jgi:hypothetical protein
MEKELRVLKVSELRVKYGKDDNKPMITGYAAVFNKLSEDLGYFREKIQPGAFKEAIKVSDARALFNHNPDYVLGRQSNETLRLKEDDKGLYMEVDPPDTQFIRDLVIAPIERGDIREQSFGFIVESDKWENLDDKSDKEPIRTILKIAELFDVSPVTFPAYPDTAVAVRSLDVAKEAMDTPPFVPLTIPELLRDFALKWEILGAPTDDKEIDLKFIELSSQIRTELNERLWFKPAEPTQGDKGEPTQAQHTSEPTQAELAKERERRNERLKKIDKEYPV